MLLRVIPNIFGKEYLFGVSRWGHSGRLVCYVQVVGEDHEEEVGKEEEEVRDHNWILRTNFNVRLCQSSIAT